MVVGGEGVGGTGQQVLLLHLRRTADSFALLLARRPGTMRLGGAGVIGAAALCLPSLQLK